MTTYKRGLFLKTSTIFLNTKKDYNDNVII